MKNFSFYNLRHPRIGKGDSPQKLNPLLRLFSLRPSPLLFIATIHKCLKRGNARKKEKIKINVTINETIEARPG